MSTDKADQKMLESATNLLETTQDIFIFQALQSGLTKQVIRELLQVDGGRVTRVSKIRSKVRPRKGD